MGVERTLRPTLRLKLASGYFTILTLLGSCAKSAAPIPTAPLSGGNGMSPRSSSTYPLVVSFESECCGTDYEAFAALERVMSDYPEGALGATRGHWGKEGEFDVCFTLRELPDSEQRRFVQRVREHVTSRLVAIGKNSICRSEQ